MNELNGTEIIKLIGLSKTDRRVRELIKDRLDSATWEQAIIMGKNMDISHIIFGCLDEASRNAYERIEDVLRDLKERFRPW